MLSSQLQAALTLLEEGRAEEGTQMLRLVAASGDAGALFILANMTWTGNPVPLDPARGRMLFEYAAALGHNEARVFATNLLASGVAGSRNWGAALDQLEVQAWGSPSRRRALSLIRAMNLDEVGDPQTVPSAKRLSLAPDVQLFGSLFSPEECAYLIDVVHDRFERSMVYNEQRQLVRDAIRISDGAALHWLIEDPAVHAINRRIAAVTDSNYAQGEPLQVLRYNAGDEYRPHFDFVDKSDNKRLRTALLYLNDTYEGGATSFIRSGLEVQGKTGDLLVFRNALADRTIDPLSEHAGLPVSNGTKFLATRWIWETQFIV